MKYYILFTQLILQSLTYNKLYVYITDISIALELYALTFFTLPVIFNYKDHTILK